MPVVSTMGLKKIYICEAGTTPDTFPTYGNNWKDLGDVYQDTCSFVDKDATITEHKSETSSKKIVMKTKEGSDLVFSIMDPSKQERADFEGGTYDAQAKTYTEPETAEQIEMAFVIVPDAGDTLLIPCASVSAKKNTTYSKKGITLLDVTANPTLAVKYAENYTVNAGSNGQEG